MMQQQIISKKELEKDFPRVYWDLVKIHDEDMEYIEECLNDKDKFQDEHVQYALERLNQIRAFFGDEPLDEKDFQED